MKRYVISLLSIAWLLLSSFQSQEVEMADGLRSNGLIYIVVFIIVIILAGLFFYLYSLDKKITRIENEAFKDKKE